MYISFVEIFGFFEVSFKERRVFVCGGGGGGGGCKMRQSLIWHASLLEII